MTPRRLLVAVVVAGALGGGSYGLAATLNGAGADALSAGTTTLGPCDSDGVQSHYAVAYAKEFVVRSVTVDGIADACVGKTLQVTLSRGASALAEGSATIVAGSPGDNHAVVPVADPPAELITRISVVIN